MGVRLDTDMVKRKLEDYSVLASRIEKRLARFTVEQLEDDLRNYLPADHRRTMERGGYAELLAAARDVARQADAARESP